MCRGGGRGYRYSLFRILPSCRSGKVCVSRLRIDGGGARVWRSGSCSFNEPPSFKTNKKKGVTDTGPCGTPRASTATVQISDGGEQINV